MQVEALTLYVWSAEGAHFLKDTPTPFLVDNLIHCQHGTQSPTMAIYYPATFTSFGSSTLPTATSLIPIPNASVPEPTDLTQTIYISAILSYHCSSKKLHSSPRRESRCGRDFVRIQIRGRSWPFSGVLSLNLGHRAFSISRYFAHDIGKSNAE